MKCNATPLLWLLPWAFIVLATRTAVAQDMEPRRWTHLPVDLNVLGVGYIYSTGDLHFDPALRIEDATVEMHTALVTYNRTFALFEQTARVDVQVPLQHGVWDGLVNGEPRSVTRDGFGDPRIRLSIDLAGAPALRGEEFVAYRRSHPVNTIVGAAVAVRLPLGDYDDSKLINLSDHRFVIEPQLGVLHTIGPWSFELTGSAFIYTDNDDFFNGNTYEQDPLLAVQAHVVHTFKGGWWISAGGAYGTGAKSTVNGVENDDERHNLLYGASIGIPLSGSQSLSLGYIRRNALADAGIDSHNFIVGWSIRF